MHVHFKVHGAGKKNLHGDGIALWYTRDRMVPGRVALRRWRRLRPRILRSAPSCWGAAAPHQGTLGPGGGWGSILLEDDPAAQLSALCGLVFCTS